MGFLGCNLIHPRASKAQSRHAPSLSPSLQLEHEPITITVEIISLSSHSWRTRWSPTRCSQWPPRYWKSNSAPDIQGTITLVSTLSEVLLPDLPSYQASIHVVGKSESTKSFPFGWSQPKAHAIRAEPLCSDRWAAKPQNLKKTHQTTPCKQRWHAHKVCSHLNLQNWPLHCRICWCRRNL